MLDLVLHQIWIMMHVNFESGEQLQLSDLHVSLVSASPASYAASKAQLQAQPRPARSPRFLWEAQGRRDSVFENRNQ